MNTKLLIKQVRNGERATIEQLVREHRDVVYRTCLAYVQRSDIAEDITQDVFIKVFDKIGQFRGDSKLSSWIIRIAVNLSLNYLRDNKKTLSQEELHDAHLLEDQNSFDWDNHIRKSVRNAIYKLPERQRKVFILSFYLTLSYNEISEITGLTISTIESLLFRARKNIKKYLQNFYENLDM